MRFALDYWMYPSPRRDSKRFLDRLDGEPPFPAAAIKAGRVGSGVRRRLYNA